MIKFKILKFFTIKCYFVPLSIFLVTSFTFGQSPAFEEISNSELLNRSNNFTQKISTLSKNTDNKRFRLVTCRMEAFNSNTITLNLFNDKSVTAVRNKIVKKRNRSMWQGSIEHSEFSNVIMFLRDSKMSARVQLNDELYIIRHLGNGVHAIVEINSDNIEPCGTE